jgi:hypothetical protein
MIRYNYIEWYNHCNIEPFEKTLNLAILANQYTSQLKQSFMGNSLIRVRKTLGFVRF